MPSYREDLEAECSSLVRTRQLIAGPLDEMAKGLLTIDPAREQQLRARLTRLDTRIEEIKAHLRRLDSGYTTIDNRSR